MQWLRDFMSFYNNASETERMVSSIPDEDDIVLVPAFTGLGAPHWQMDARGAIFGLTRDTSKEQLTRAALKSIAHQSMDVLHAMEEDTGKKIEELRVDGGATANEYLMQYQSNILSIPVALPAITESTALGASYLAGVSLGLYKTIDEIASYNVISKIYSPSMEKDERVRERRKWLIAVKRLTTQIQLED
jgi:glycerol kinase